MGEGEAARRTGVTVWVDEALFEWPQAQGWRVNVDNHMLFIYGEGTDLLAQFALWTMVQWT